METMNSMKRQTISNLQDLVEINLDSAEGFKSAAENVEDSAIRDLFDKLSGQRSHFAEQLKGFVRRNGEVPEDTGSMKGKAHRWWMDLRSTLTNDDVEAMLTEAERGEDHIKGLYEQVILDTSGSPVNDVLHAHYAQVKDAHDRIRDLRDLAKEVS